MMHLWAPSGVLFVDIRIAVTVFVDDGLWHSCCYRLLYGPRTWYWSTYRYGIGYPCSTWLQHVLSMAASLNVFCYKLWPFQIGYFLWVFDLFPSLFLILSTHLSMIICSLTAILGPFPKWAGVGGFLALGLRHIEFNTDINCIMYKCVM